MPFDLKQTSEWFQLLMNEVLRPVLGKCIVVYLDDIIIFSKEPEQHVKDVIAILELIRKAHLQIKLRKCEFFQSEIKFLGHKISEEGIHTDPKKVEAIQTLPAPKNLRDIQSVMELFQYYKNFILDFVRIVTSIYKVMKKEGFKRLKS